MRNASDIGFLLSFGDVHTANGNTISTYSWSRAALRAGASPAHGAPVSRSTFFHVQALDVVYYIYPNQRFLEEEHL
jgi:hypothetical protein